MCTTADTSTSCARQIDFGEIKRASPSGLMHESARGLLPWEGRYSPQAGRTVASLLSKTLRSEDGTMFRGTTIWNKYSSIHLARCSRVSGAFLGKRMGRKRGEPVGHDKVAVVSCSVGPGVLNCIQARVSPTAQTGRNNRSGTLGSHDLAVVVDVDRRDDHGMRHGGVLRLQPFGFGHADAAPKGVVVVVQLRVHDPKLRVGHLADLRRHEYGRMSRSRSRYEDGK